jgi:hypothetical protein
MLIFPNLIVIDLPPGITVRRVEPISPGCMDVQAWFALPDGEPRLSGVTSTIWSTPTVLCYFDGGWQCSIWTPCGQRGR